MTEVYVRINGQDYAQSSLTLPSNRLFREAWAAPSAGVVQVDMPAAKEIWKDKLRADRAPRYSSHDLTVTKGAAKGIGNGSMTGQEKQAILDAEAEREKLRNITSDSRISNASTPEALSALTIDVLLA